MQAPKYANYPVGKWNRISANTWTTNPATAMTRRREKRRKGKFVGGKDNGEAQKGESKVESATTLTQLFNMASLLLLRNS